ncbi:MAG: glycosyltransferase family 2 protein [Opitutaceae bacterium]|nr:glycosyltransferase family 2 protein [Opitutaceae bacterium]
MSAFPLSPTETAPPELSIVIPFYNEAENIPPLLAELRQAVETIGIPVEILAVDDCSRDATLEALGAVAASWPALQVIHLGVNGGQAIALWRGFERVRGRWVATLDGDGQNPPLELVKLWTHRESADMLVGARQGRQDSLGRRVMSRIANHVRRFLLRDGVSDSGCALRLFRREVLGSLPPFRTLYSFMPACAVSGGWKVREIPVAHRARTAGVANYTFRKMAILPFLDTLAFCWVLRRMLRLAPPRDRNKP